MLERIWNKLTHVRKKRSRQRDISDQEQFRNSIQFAHEIIDNTGTDRIDSGSPHPLVDVIRLLGRNVQAKSLSHMLYHKDSKQAHVGPEHCFFPEDSVISWDPLLLFRDIKKELDVKKDCELNRDVVLPWPWNRSRLVKCIAGIGNGRSLGPWEQDVDNHSLEVWLPMGLSWVKGGNHSIAAGIIQGTGAVTSEHVYDISRIYDYIDCDGRNYIRKQDKKPIAPVTNIECAAIFEIGRLMKDNSISY